MRFFYFFISEMSSISGSSLPVCLFIHNKICKNIPFKMNFFFLRIIKYPKRKSCLQGVNVYKKQKNLKIIAKSEKNIVYNTFSPDFLSVLVVSNFVIDL